MAESTTLDELTETPHAEVFEDQAPRTVRLQLDAGEEIPPHTHPGMDIVLHVLSGRLEVGLGEETHDLEAGQLVQFSGDREVSPSAVDPSTALIVFAPRSDD